MKNKSFRKKDGSFVFKNDGEAQVIGEFLEQKFPTGQIHPETIVSIAQDDSCPIHKYFEWDDSKAAHEYRLTQARHLLRSLCVVVEGGEEVRAYHNVKISSGGMNEYVSFEEARNAPDLWSQVLESALREAVNWKARYENYKELSPIVEAIKQTEKELNG